MLDKFKALMDMKNKMAKIKEELDSTIFEIASSDGLVKISMSASQELKNITVQSNLPENESALLEEAVKDSINRAIKRSHEISAQKTREITGLNIPGMM